MAVGMQEKALRVTPKERKVLLDALNNGSQLQANIAGRRITETRDPAFLPGVLRVLRQGRKLHNRVEAAYVIRGMDGAKGTASLEKILRNSAESPRLRAWVAETLAHRHRPSSHDVLLRNLNDPSRDVRFWCAFALGQMRESKALPLLKALVHEDTRMVRGWWTVSKEARDAIRNITRKKGWGIRFCARCR
jgi:HEAT repeat protein